MSIPYRLLAVSICVLIALTGCDTITGAWNAITSPNPNVVATMEAALAAADNAALAYVTLPSCKAPSPAKICRDPTVTKNIGVAAKVAYTAIKAAEANETSSSVQAAQNALAAYQQITASVQ